MLEPSTKKKHWKVLFTFLNCLSLLSDLAADAGGISGALRAESPVVSVEKWKNTSD